MQRSSHSVYRPGITERFPAHDTGDDWLCNMDLEQADSLKILNDDWVSLLEPQISGGTVHDSSAAGSVPFLDIIMACEPDPNSATFGCSMTRNCHSDSTSPATQPRRNSCSTKGMTLYQQPCHDLRHWKGSNYSGFHTQPQQQQQQQQRQATCGGGLTDEYCNQRHLSTSEQRMHSAWEQGSHSADAILHYNSSVIDRHSLNDVAVSAHDVSTCGLQYLTGSHPMHMTNPEYPWSPAHRSTCDIPCSLPTAATVPPFLPASDSERTTAPLAAPLAAALAPPAAADAWHAPSNAFNAGRQQALPAAAAAAGVAPGYSGLDAPPTWWLQPSLLSDTSLQVYSVPVSAVEAPAHNSTNNSPQSSHSSRCMQQVLHPDDVWATCQPGPPNILQGSQGSDLVGRCGRSQSPFSEPTAAGLAIGDFTAQSITQHSWESPSFPAASPNLPAAAAETGSVAPRSTECPLTAHAMYKPVGKLRHSKGSETSKAASTKVAAAGRAGKVLRGGVSKAQSVSSYPPAVNKSSSAKYSREAQVHAAKQACNDKVAQLSCKQERLRAVLTDLQESRDKAAAALHKLRSCLDSMTKDNMRLRAVNMDMHRRISTLKSELP